jgi:hypothetical protein
MINRKWGSVEIVSLFVEERRRTQVKIRREKQIQLTGK